MSVEVPVKELLPGCSLLIQCCLRAVFGQSDGCTSLKLPTVLLRHHCVLDSLSQGRQCWYLSQLRFSGFIHEPFGWYFGVVPAFGTDISIAYTGLRNSCCNIIKQQGVRVPVQLAAWLQHAIISSASIVHAGTHRSDHFLADLMQLVASPEKCAVCRKGCVAPKIIRISADCNPHLRRCKVIYLVQPAMPLGGYFGGVIVLLVLVDYPALAIWINSNTAYTNIHMTVPAGDVHVITSSCCSSHTAVDGRHTVTGIDTRLLASTVHTPSAVHHQALSQLFGILLA